jgi:outer membrane protein TolC
MLGVGLLAAGELQSLTIEECVRLGLERNPGLKSSQAATDLAQAKVREAYASALPSLRLSGGYTRLSEVDPFVITLPSGPGQPVHAETLGASIPNNYAARLSLQQPVFTGLRLVSATRIAREYKAAAREDFAASRAKLVYDIQSAYWSLYKAQHLQRVVAQSELTIQAHLSDAGNLKAQGLATQNDVMKVRVQLANVRVLKLDAENAQRLARTALASLIGLELDAQVEPASALDTLGEPMPSALDSLVRQAQANRPELAGLEHRTRMAADAVTVAAGAWYPQVALTGNYYYSRPNQRYQPVKDEFKKSWDLGLGATFDVWNWGMTLHQTAEARAQLAQARAGLEQLRNAVVLEVTQDWQALRSAVEKTSATREALLQATENRRVVEESFKAGAATSSDRLDAETMLLQAEVNHTQAQVDRVVAEAKLRKTVGEK